MRFDASGRPDIQPPTGGTSRNIASGCAVTLGFVVLLAGGTLLGTLATSDDGLGAGLAMLYLGPLIALCTFGVILFLILARVIRGAKGPDVSLDSVLRGTSGAREKGALADPDSARGGGPRTDDQVRA